ncbi:hypothetical protein J8J40_25435, partial [Mycobacterium tuberculosis]|nr:hypothetical protein [Mycobacterium tuberculosis]
IMGVLMGFAAFAISPAMLAWMAPTLIGLIFAVNISYMSGSLSVGLTLRRWRLLLIPEETNPPPIIAAARAAQAAAGLALPEVEDGLTTVVLDGRVRALHESLL